MIKEKSCGAITYKIENGIYYFLIEKMNKGHFSLPKGHVEKGESEVETAYREIKEETNLDVIIDENFKEVISYSPYKDCIKDVVFFVAKVKSEDIKAQEIEVSEIMFLPFDEAYKKLTHRSDKEVFLKAYLYLICKYIDKIIIIGCPGSGKSYLSRYLKDYSKLPLYHLDNLYWFGDYDHISEEEFVSKVNKIMSTDKWIIDGHFKSSIEDRIKNAQAIIYFNLSGKVCVNGVKHRIKYHSVRDDMPCVEKVLDKEFEECMLHFKENNHESLLSLFNKYPSNVLTITNKRQLKEIISFLSKDVK